MSSTSSQRRRRALRAAAPAAGLLAAGLLVWQGSYAAFSATTTNDDNAWTTGTLALKNNGGPLGTYEGSTAASFAEEDFKPGQVGTQCITVKATGTASGSLKMYVTNVSDTSLTTLSQRLSDQLKVTITAAPVAVTVPGDCSGFPTSTDPSIVSITSNTGISALPTNYAAAPVALAVGAGDVTEQLVAYKITWTFATQGSTDADNTLQGATVHADLNWELQ